MQIVSSWNRINALPPVAKTGIVAGGYVAALLTAVAVVSIYITLTDGPDREASGGMYAFGDSILFVAVFGMASTIPTGLALVFLRRSRRFWLALCAVALLVAITSLGAVAAIMLEPQQLASRGGIHALAMFAVPRIFAAPFVAMSFGLSALLAPGARFRWCLCGAAGMEAIASLYGFFHWFAPMIFR